MAPIPGNPFIMVLYWCFDFVLYLEKYIHTYINMHKHIHCWLTVQPSHQYDIFKSQIQLGQTHLTLCQCSDRAVLQKYLTKGDCHDFMIGLYKGQGLENTGFSIPELLSV